jgi:hypothetical protein
MYAQRPKLIYTVLFSKEWLWLQMTVYELRLFE